MVDGDQLSDIELDASGEPVSGWIKTQDLSTTVDSEDFTDGGLAGVSLLRDYTMDFDYWAVAYGADVVTESTDESPTGPFLRGPNGGIMRTASGIVRP